MKPRFETLYRGCLVFLLLLAGWSLWAGAQAATNAPTTTNTPAATTNRPSGLARTFEEATAHPLTFKLDEVPFLQKHAFLGEPAWKYVASLLYILLAFYAAKLIDWVTKVWFKRLALRTETKLDDLLLDLLHGPIKVVVFVVLLEVGLNLFDWSPTAKLYLSKGLVLVVASSLTYLGVKITLLLLDVWKARTAHETDRRFNEQLFSFIRKSLTFFIIIVAVLVTAQNLGVNITAAITSLSIGGLAVGLAAQDTLANLFGAIAVLVDKPFHVGDFIKVDIAEGQVEAVGLRSTRVRSADGYLFSVPNKTVGNAVISNLSQRGTMRTVMNFPLSRNLPKEKIERALALLAEVYRGHALTQEAWISFNQFTGGNINLQVIHWWKVTDYQKYLAGMQEMNLAIKSRFDAEGIQFA